MRIRNWLRTLAVVITAVLCLSATEQKGIVKFGGLPVPGATVTATQGDKKVIAVTDQDGKYVLPDLADGDWAIEIEMQGFATLKQDVKVVAGAEPQEFEIKMMPFDQIKSVAAEPPPPPTTANTAPSGGLPASAVKPPDPKKNAKNAPQPNPNGTSGFQRTQANATANANAAPANNSAPTSDAFAGQSPSDLSSRATDGLLVNGTTNNAATSPFALNSAFGNNRRGARSLYNGNLGFTLDNSSFDARAFSITGQDTAKPTYNLFSGLASFGGPIKIPHVVRNGPNLFVSYQWTRNRNASDGTGLMPTQAERDGDFSQVAGLGGKPLVLTDPTTGQPIQGNVISPTRINSVAQSLLNLYPLPNFTGSAFNYQIPLVSPQHIDAMQARWNKNASRKDALQGGVGFQDSRMDTPSILGFLDTTDSFGIQSNISWRHAFTNRLSGTAGYQWSRQSSSKDPFFANRENISGEAGIEGNNQQPINWGPPTLGFSSGINALSDSTAQIVHNQTGALSYAMYWNRGRHNFQYGVDFKRQQFNTIGQSNPRGAYTFTGAASGNDFADFLLGVPDAASVAFGNADKYLRDNLWDGFFTDDWRISPGFTANLGARWEYNSPITELYGRLVNLDVANGFTAVAPVLASNPIGPLTGIHYPSSLMNPDKHAFMPKIAISWRPLAASSLVVRAGYGTYYNTNVYQSIASQMSQQPPLSKSISLANSPATPLTLANGFNATPISTPNTFAVDPNFKVGYTHTWQVTIQRDLPFAMQMNAQYLGIKGVRQVQEFYPNTYPVGETTPCPACPVGFAYMASNGNSTREAGILQLRRRLHNGFQAQLQYTYSKSIDDAALGGGNQIGTLVAQNWLNLSGERALSTFDQRHVANITGQYTSGMGMGGGALVGGWRGALLKEWTILTNITVATGTPLTPNYTLITPGTAVSLERPDYTGASVYSAPPGLFLNPAAYANPAPGEWGNAGRDSITGPSQFSLGASLQRTFRLTDRFSLDFRLDSTNTLNHVTYPSWNTTLGNTQFGLPNTANQMRKIVARVTLKF